MPYFFLFLILNILTAFCDDAVSVNNNRIIDSSGRERFFRGFNTVVKGPPFTPITDYFDPHMSLSYQDFQIMKDMGQNVIRLGMMWAGSEPERGKFNETYFDEMKKIVSMAAKYDVSVLIDFHQDVISAKTCGEGLPDWAFPEPSWLFKFPFPLMSLVLKDTNDVPLRNECEKLSWPGLYFTYGASHTFGNLYSNENGLLDLFANFWTKVAYEFRNFPNVIGYELINEPFSGNIFNNPSLMVPGKADKVNLQPMYRKLNDAIRKVDTKKLIFFEGVTWDNMYFGFDESPGGKEYSHLSVISYHYYYYFSNGGGPNILDLEGLISARLKNAKQLGCGLMLTEFNATSTELWDNLMVADKYLQSNIAWSYKDFYNITGDMQSIFIDDSGTINLTLAKMYSRPYPLAVAGKTISFGTSKDFRNFNLVYQYDSKVTADTIIVFNTALYFHKGYKLSVTSYTGKVAVIDVSQENKYSNLITDRCYKTESLSSAPKNGQSIGGHQRIALRHTGVVHDSTITFSLTEC